MSTPNQPSGPEDAVAAVAFAIRTATGDQGLVTVEAARRAVQALREYDAVHWKEPVSSREAIRSELIRQHMAGECSRVPGSPPVRDDELGLLPVLRVWYGDCELWADCGNCGVRIGDTIPPNLSIEVFTRLWEAHAMKGCTA